LAGYFADRLAAAIRDRGTCAVVGIDPVYERLPAELAAAGGQRPTPRRAVDVIGTFCRGVIDVVAPLAPVVKINSAFFEAFYGAGVDLYYDLTEYAHRRGLLVIGDVKRGDIGSTAELYARAHLAPPGASGVDPARIPDAVTLAGYLGRGAVRPFIDVARETGKGMFVLVRPSDPGADEVHEYAGADQTRFYQFMAARVRAWGEGLVGECGYSNVGAVVAAKDAESTRALRAAMPQTLFLVPGYGAQGATAESCRACFREDGSGAVVNASRSVIFAYEKPGATERFGDDWRGAIEQACREFVADLASMFDR
jgi:orotidine-5'-phosphate decarboxylase